MLLFMLGAPEDYEYETTEEKKIRKLEQAQKRALSVRRAGEDKKEKCTPKRGARVAGSTQELKKRLAARAAKIDRDRQSDSELEKQQMKYSKIVFENGEDETEEEPIAEDEEVLDHHRVKFASETKSPNKAPYRNTPRKWYTKEEELEFTRADALKEEEQNDRNALPKVNGRSDWVHHIASRDNLFVWVLVVLVGTSFEGLPARMGFGFLILTVTTFVVNPNVIEALAKALLHHEKN
jgi:hypothetical protein